MNKSREKASPVLHQICIQCTFSKNTLIKLEGDCFHFSFTNAITSHRMTFLLFYHLLPEFLKW